MTKEHITTKSAEKLRKMRGETNPNAPEGPELGPDFWKEAKLVFPDGPKEQITVRVDADVLEWFKKQGRGYQTRMNAVLRAYYDAQQPK